MPPNITAVILAAGQSTRMGKPKMLLPWGQPSVLGQVVATFAQAGVSQIVVVTGGARQAVEAEAARLAEAGFPLRCVHNPHYASGEMLSSLQCGLAALGPECDSALIGLGDQPQISPQAVRSVIAGYETTGARLVVPSYNMRRGHPWLVQRALWEQLLALREPQTLRDFLNACAAEILYVDADPTILKDLDTPEQYQREKP